ncbi:sensor histidine kinase [Agrobacterium rosae]|uniref:sensor histidine kinase n=1 Tax=Agrobacterium rosae TaxID=1972867 RepID=UPI003A80D67B
MSVDTNRNASLWWKLSWQLSLVVIGVIVTVIAGVCAYGITILPSTISLKHPLAAALHDAIVRDSQGKLLIEETQDLRAFLAKQEGLWFVVSAKDNVAVSYGPVPTEYRDLGPYLHLIKDAELRRFPDIKEASAIDDIETIAGRVHVMYGGTPNRGLAFLTLLAAFYPIYVPLLIAAIPAIFLTVPRIVSRALAGLKDVVRKAPEIDPRRAGGRLPTANVPNEVFPLIVAFNSILERLEKQFQARQRFLVDAAHELRTPIAIMQTRIEGMSEGAEQRRLMGDVARLGVTAEQLLDFERNDQAGDRHETIDIVDLCRNVVADFAPLAIAAGYEISFQSEIDTLECQGNPSSLPRAVSNLVSNAIDHGGNGGIILVSVFREGRIAISDQGPGIPEDQQQLVFEPFYRITPRSTGAGLGLSLVRQVISNHHGRVEVESTSAGTTFAIVLDPGRRTS